jgi:hypothetical protein
LSAKIGDFSLERRDLALQRSDQLLNFGGKTHPTLDTDETSKWPKRSINNAYILSTQRAEKLFGRRFNQPESSQ